MGLFDLAISRANREKLVYAVCKVISHAPHARALEETEQLCAPSLAVILMLQEGSEERPSVRELDFALQELDLVCTGLTVTHSVPELEHPVLAVIKAAWPGLDRLFSTPPVALGINEDDSKDIVARAWKLIHSALMTLRSLASVFLDALLGEDDKAGLIVTSFEISPSKFVLDCACCLYGEFQEWEPCHEALARMLTQLTNCYTSNFECQREEPDVTAGLLDLLSKSIQLNRSCAFLNPDVAAYALQLGTEGLKMRELPSIRAAVRLTCVLIRKSSEVRVTVRPSIDIQLTGKLLYIAGSRTRGSIQRVRNITS